MTDNLTEKVMENDAVLLFLGANSKTRWLSITSEIVLNMFLPLNIVLTISPSVVRPAGKC